MKFMNNILIPATELNELVAVLNNTSNKSIFDGLIQRFIWEDPFINIETQ